MSTTSPKNLIEAVRYFSDLDVCHAYMISVKWPDGKITCPKCGGDKVGSIASRRMLQCKAKDCRKQFSAKVGTIFEDSPLGLDKWFVAVWCITNAKNGISSCEVARALGVTQKSAWHLLHRVRLAMRTGTFQKMTGTIEADETFVGGKSSNMHKSKREEKITGTGNVDKTAVMGLLQRTTEGAASQVRAGVVPNVKRETLLPIVRDHVEPGAHVYTDSLKSYLGLSPAFDHKTIDHAVSYAEGEVHTNGLENFWALFKRCLKGTYIHVAPKNLDRYVGEETFRFNERKGDDGYRFTQTMKGVIGKRLTYAKLAAGSA